jgi:hypothetical protein
MQGLPLEWDARAALSGRQVKREVKRLDIKVDGSTVDLACARCSGRSCLVGGGARAVIDELRIG